MKLTIYWIRHGLSCANIHKYIHAVKHDPQLTYDGLECSENTNKYVPKKLDFLFASELKRAIETALSMFSENINDSNQKVISVPFVSEQGFGLDNIISKTSKLRKYFKPIMKNLDLSIHSKSHNSMNKADLKLFFKFLKDFIKSKGEIKKNIRIGIVTHSHFMKHNHICKFVKGKATKPKNNSIFKIEYNCDNLDDISKLYNVHKEKNIATQIFGGCDFSLSNYNSISCTKNTCKKTPIENSKNYYRCSKSSKYSNLMNTYRSRTLKNLTKIGGKRSRKRTTKCKF